MNNVIIYTCLYTNCIIVFRAILICRTLPTEINAPFTRPYALRVYGQYTFRVSTHTITIIRYVKQYINRTIYYGRGAMTHHTTSLILIYNVLEILVWIYARSEKINPRPVSRDQSIKKKKIIIILNKYR